MSFGEIYDKLLEGKGFLFRHGASFSSENRLKINIGSMKDVPDESLRRVDFYVERTMTIKGFDASKKVPLT